VLALLLALIGVNLAAFRTQVASSPTQDAASSDDRLRELRRWLQSEARVGYVTDETPVVRSATAHQYRFPGQLAAERYYRVQYALAPIVVDIGATEQFVIANSDRFDPRSRPEFALVHDFGDGLMLLRQRADAW
jgi:hypothetical protein